MGKSKSGVNDANLRSRRHKAQRQASNPKHGLEPIVEEWVEPSQLLAHEQEEMGDEVDTVKGIMDYMDEPSEDGKWSARDAMLKRRSQRRKSKSRASEPYVAKAGLNYGFPDKELYKATRKKVLERLEEIEPIGPIPSPGETKFKMETDDYFINKNYHYLHGKVYDLREFYSKHPGGKSILQMTAGIPDATSMFESYHAFADRDGILKRMQAYEVTDDEEALSRRPAQLFSFEEGGFYDDVTRRVREYFGAKEFDKMNESVMPRVKVNHRWRLKVGLQMALHAICFVLAFIVRLPLPLALVFAFLAGMFQIQWGFTVFHDASHRALGARDHWMNDFFTRFWAALSLWEGRVWMSHHAVWHHSFTGSPSLDPDVQHATPMVRKTPDTPGRKDNGFFRWLGDKYGMKGWGAAAILIYAFLPGMWFGQARVYLMYKLAGKSKNMPKDVKMSRRLWGMPAYNDVKGYTTPWWEVAVYVTMILLQVQRLNPLVTFVYAVALNIFYSMCIVADHDLAESAVVNHVDFEPVHRAHPEHGTDAAVSPTGEKTDSLPDWGEMQVRNTTNFDNSKLNLFGMSNGNINWQIEHHLFPGVCHIHLPRLAPIVRQACKDHDIPYTTYPNLIDAWYSFLITLRAVMTEKHTTAEEVDKIKRIY